MYIIVGLGNPGVEYSRTRHNTGRMATEFMSGKVSGIKIITPDTFMNKTGVAVVKVVKSKKAAENLIVLYDDLDLPLGTLKISYNRSSGGHKGLESIIKALKTREFIRIRIGIGKKDDVEKHILGEFKKSELETLKKVFKCTSEAVQMIVEDGLERAMNKFNQ
ncbi:MAG: Peptidyl-tRNA hydrolase [Parcubacteria group bacterium GW2011_GWB1_38_8]|nr:MAG: Peptidyl-tRNA hydrolase [Parcubacteria group bacterium GW2011_GWB1_38_8]KKR30124.1 MAG: Peptidyl-tRNA hydrolase [Parcubacteria group bacterium GW2011_GWC1_39_8]